MKKKFYEFFMDENNQFSSMRLIFICWSFCFMSMWIISCFSSKPISLQPIPSSLETFFGMLLFGKVSQKFSENKVNKNIIEENENNEK